jgi:hypothetical protein
MERAASTDNARSLLLYGAAAALMWGAAFFFVLWDEKLEFSYSTYAELWSSSDSKAHVVRWMIGSAFASACGAVASFIFRPTLQASVCAALIAAPFMAAIFIQSLNPIGLTFVGFRFVPAALCGALFIAAARVNLSVRKRATA